MAWEREHGIVVVPEKPRIALLLPHTGLLSAEFAEKTWGPLRWVPLNWCDKIPLFCRVPSLPLARNILAQQALDAKATHLFWIDSDHVFENPADPNEALRQLYLCDASIACGLYRAKQKIGFNYAAWVKVGEMYTPIQSWEGNWITVDVTGLGCALIRAEVFKAVKEPWFHWEEPEAVSEDFAFYEKCREAGFEVKVFTDVRLSHLGELKVLSDGSVTTRDV